MMGRRSVGMFMYQFGDLEVSLMSSRAAVAGLKKCSRVHIDNSVHDFVHQTHWI